jgi:HTH-type transcriptional regulator/antitoxin HigA
MVNLQIKEDHISMAFHPGEYLKKEIEERGWTQVYLAKIMGMTKAEVNNLIHGRKDVTPRVASRIATTFQTSVDLWLGLQNMYDMWILQKDKKEMERINKIKERLVSLSIVSI